MIVRNIFAAVLVLLTLVVANGALAGDAIGFNRDIRPILSQNCFRCHGPDEGQREADLRLDEEEGVRVAFGGDLIESEAWRRINSSDSDERMPPAGSKLELSQDQIKTIRRWIAGGAKWQGHWAFIPPARPAVPSVQQQDRVNNPIDAFIQARLEEENVHPVGPADPQTLIRRLSLDIVGLPPSPEEVDAFLKDCGVDAEKSPGGAVRIPQSAIEKAVDRLLASEHYGERMAIYWLDLVRYADSVGYHKDSHRDCWLYRDWVIRAFNQNLPYDQFATRQLAGDLLEGPKLQQYEWKIASGFNRMNQTTSEGGAQAKEYLAKYSADRVRNTAAIFLGVTMGCAECHDHKYDPFTTKDFYSFAAFFADVQERGVGYPSHTPMPTLDTLDRWGKLETQLAGARKQLEAAAAAGEPVDALQAKVESLEKEIAKLSDSKSWPKTLVTSGGKPRTIRVLPRGNWLDDSGPQVQPAIPEFLGSLPKDERATRLDLAEWVASRENPLTARVLVNRLWKMYFGEGISRTLDDLGSQGEWPSHPALLDWLAIELVDSGWDIKHMVKLIVMSDAYQRSSVCPDDLRQRDPENRLLARQSSFRLPAELIRDNALAISGLLSPKMYGPSVKPYQPANYWYRLYKDGKYVQDHGEDLYRRGVYTYWRRSFWHPSLRAFDAPAREECVAQRPRSNTPAQSLVLLNDPTFVEAARVLATKMIEARPEERIAWAFRRAVARRPSQEETALLSQLHAQLLKRYEEDEESARKLINVGEHPVPEDTPPAQLAAWTSVARAILNMHETITRN